MYLRHALAATHVSSKRVKHDLHKLFKMLPEDGKELVSKKYADAMKRHVQGALGRRYLETGTAEDFLRFLGKSPITDMRYIWDPPARHGRHQQEDNMDLKREFELDALLYAVQSLCPPNHTHDDDRR